MEYEEISATWGEVERVDLVRCGTFAAGWSLVMAVQDIPGQTSRVALRLREPSTGREDWVTYNRTRSVRLRRPCRT